MKILVSGGSGFIGSHLVDKLVELGHQVRIVDIVKKNLNKKAEYIRTSILEYNELLDLTKDVDFIFHFAADPNVRESIKRPVEFFKNNVVGTLNLLNAARENKIRNFMFASSSTVYGVVAKFPISEETKSLPISIYGGTKAACDNLICAYSHSYNINCTSLIFANIYGPRSNHGVIYDFYKKLKKDGSKLEILGNGKQKKSYLYIDDAIDAIILLSRKMEGYQYYNVGSDKWYSVIDIANIVSKEMGLNPKYEFTGGDVGWKGDVPKFLLDVSKLKSEGWREKVTIREGIKEYIHYLNITSS